MDQLQTWNQAHYSARENENIMATKSIYKDCHWLSYHLLIPFFTGLEVNFNEFQILEIYQMFVLGNETKPGPDKTKMVENFKLVPTKDLKFRLNVLNNKIKSVITNTSLYSSIDRDEFSNNWMVKYTDDRQETVTRRQRNYLYTPVFRTTKQNRRIN